MERHDLGLDHGDVDLKQGDLGLEQKNLVELNVEDIDKGLPFKGMQIHSHDPLKRLSSRYLCHTCQKSLRYYCYHCVQLNPQLESPQRSVPLVTLPSSLPLLIIKDARELPGKSTAIHAKLLAPSQVQLMMVDIKDLPDLELGPKVAVLFPSSQAQTVENVNWMHIKRLVVIDGTWQQARSIVNSPLMKGALPVKLGENYRTLFWRYQNLGPNCLSTIEAIYYFYQEYTRVTEGKPNPDLDNLLYFFSFQYKLIQEDYKRNINRKFTSKHCTGYIKDG